MTFNVIALGFVIDYRFVLAYLTTLPLIIISILSTRSSIKFSSKIAQENRTKMMQSLSYAWDSVLIGNTWNLNMWKKNFGHRHSEAKNSALKSTILVEVTGNYYRLDDLKFSFGYWHTCLVNVF